MRMTSESFAKHVLAGVRPASDPFKPTATYNPDGDCIEFLVSAESYYGERVDHLLTVFYSHRTGAIIGSLIKGVKAHLKKTPNLVVSFDDGRIRIDHFLISQAIAADRPLKSVAIHIYKKLVTVAQESNVTVEVPDISGELCEA